MSHRRRRRRLRGIFLGASGPDFGRLGVGGTVALVAKGAAQRGAAAQQGVFRSLQRRERVQGEADVVGCLVGLKRLPRPRRVVVLSLTGYPATAALGSRRLVGEVRHDFAGSVLSRRHGPLDVCHRLEKRPKGRGRNARGGALALLA